MEGKHAWLHADVCIHAFGALCDEIQPHLKKIEDYKNRCAALEQRDAKRKQDIAELKSDVYKLQRDVNALFQRMKGQTQGPNYNGPNYHDRNHPHGGQGGNEGGQKRYFDQQGGGNGNSGAQKKTRIE